MYVCVCHGITDHAIRDAVRAGANSLDDLRCRLGVATQCGMCGPVAEDLLADELARGIDNGMPPPSALSAAA